MFNPLKFFHGQGCPPVPGTPVFKHLVAQLHQQHVLDGAGCLRRAVRHGWTCRQLRTVIGDFARLAREDPESWAPWLLYDLLNLGKPGARLTEHPRVLRIQVTTQ